MGAWGVGYNENDNYLDEVVNATESILKTLKATIAESKNDEYVETFTLLRSHTFLAYQMITSINDDSPENLVHISDVFHDALITLHRLALANLEEWENPDEFVIAFETEKETLEKWLSDINPHKLSSSSKASSSSVTPSHLAKNLAKLNNKTVPVAPKPSPVATPGGSAIKFLATTRVATTPRNEKENSKTVKPTGVTPADVFNSTRITVTPNTVALSFTSQRIVIEGYNAAQE